MREEAAMNRWLRRIRGAVGMGLTWAVGWPLGGVLIGMGSILLPGLPWEAFFEVFDAPLPALAGPGFLGGVIFSSILGIAGRHRRFDELSLARVAAWGALGGLLLGLLPSTMVLLGLATSTGKFSLGMIAAMLVVPTTLLAAVSASGSLALARMSEDRELLDAGSKVAEVRLTGEEERAMLGADS
jgi:hypothetical protein